MHRAPLPLLSALLLGFTSQIGTANAQSADADAVKAANAAFYEALSSRDMSAVENVWAKDGKVFNIFGAAKKPLVGWAAIRAGYEGLFKRFVQLSVAIPEPLIRLDGGIALVVGVEALEAKLANGETAKLNLPTTNVFAKQGGRWLMIHHHSSRPPN